MPTHLRYVIIDTMTTRPFQGNPTPVFILDHLDEWLSAETMQLLAREMNYSDTAFVRRRQLSNPNDYTVRWFTPHREEVLCGHAVVACTIALHAAFGTKVFSFTTPKNMRSVARVLPPNPTTGAAMVKFGLSAEPVLPLQVIDDSYKDGYASALGIHPSLIVKLGRNSLMDVAIEVDPRVDICTAALTGVDAVKLMKASPSGTRSQVVTCRAPAGSGFHFFKRVWAYGYEDQATGSTYSMLVPYWGERLGATEMRAQQPSARGGEAALSWKKDEGIVQITAGGIKTAEGIVMVPLPGKHHHPRLMSNL